jgi:imidazolonepropionase-like amidohydrolase
VIEPDEQALAIVGGRLIDGRGGPPRPDSCVVISRGRIQAVGPRSHMAVPVGARRIDAVGRTVLPGLMDLHVHSQAPADLLLYVKYGVTTIRYAGGFQHELLPLKARVESGEIPGPRIFSSGPVLDGLPVTHPHHGEGLRDAEQARQVARRLIDQERVDALIVTQEVTPEIVTAIVDEANTSNVPVTAQVHQISARQAVELGVDGLENTARIPESALVSDQDVLHYPSVPARLATLLRLWIEADEAKLESLLQLMAERDVTLDPALVSLEIWSRQGDAELLANPDVQRYVPPEQLAYREAFLNRISGAWTDSERALVRPAIQRYQRFVKRFHDLRGRVVVGTDQPLGALALHRELQLLLEAGLSPAEVLYAATRQAGLALRAAPLGILVAGAPADLIVVQGDPLADLTVLRRPSEVFVGGRPLVFGGEVLA